MNFVVDGLFVLEANLYLKVERSGSGTFLLENSVIGVLRNSVCDCNRRLDLFSLYAGIKQIAKPKNLIPQL